MVKSTTSMSLPGSIVKVAQVIQQAGFLVYVAGGAVRDHLLGRVPHDFDLVTDASIAQLQGLFPKVLLLGSQFGVCRIVLPSGEVIECAQFRQDGPTANGRHPTEVLPASPEQDAWRRDFTVNGLFFDPWTGQILDYVGGLADLESKTLRFIGQAQQRIAEDHLRVLRGWRFQAQLGLGIEEQTLVALRSGLPLVPRVAKERIHEELLRWASGEHFPEQAPTLPWLELQRSLVPEAEMHQMGLKYRQSWDWSQLAKGLFGSLRPSPWFVWAALIFEELRPLVNSKVAMDWLAKIWVLNRLERQHLVQESFWSQFQAPPSEEEALILWAEQKVSGRSFGLFFPEVSYPRFFLTETLQKELAQLYPKAEQFPALSGEVLGKTLRQEFHRRLQRWFALTLRK